jgi:Domain of unknown function (DUF4381)
MMPATTASPDAASLDRLHDIVRPPPVAWWPPAPGWIIFAALILLLFLVITAWLLRRRKLNLYRRQALAELQQSTASPASISILLKRVALSVYPRDQVASLTGKSWLEFLRQTNGHFGDRVGQLLVESPYDAGAVKHVSNDDLHALTTAARFWISHHRPPAVKKEAKQC